MAEDREIAGIRCMQVLEKLDDYVDGALDATTQDQIERHLEGCDWCTKFGGEYGALVTTLRSGLKSAAQADTDKARDLASALLARK